MLGYLTNRAVSHKLLLLICYIDCLLILYQFFSDSILMLF